MTADLIPLHLTEKWAEVVQGVREKAQDDAKSIDLTNFDVGAVLSVALTDCYSKARWRASTQADADGVPWKILTDENRVTLILHYHRAYIEAIQSRFEEIVSERRSRSDA